MAKNRHNTQPQRPRDLRSSGGVYVETEFGNAGEKLQKVLGEINITRLTCGHKPTEERMAQILRIIGVLTDDE